MGSTDNDREGIIPFAVSDFFRRKAELEEEGAVVELFMSYLEIYNEKCYDLLSTVMKDKNRDNKDNKEGKENKDNKESKENKENKENVRENKEGNRENGPKSADERPCLGNVWDNSKGETVLEGLTNMPVPDQLEAARCVLLRCLQQLFLSKVLFSDQLLSRMGRASVRTVSCNRQQFLHCNCSYFPSL